MWAGRHGDWRLGGLLIADPRILNSPASLIALSRIADDVGRTARSRLRSRFGVTLAGDPATTKEVIQLLMGEMGTDSALAERIAVHPVVRADSALFYRFLSALDWYPALCDQALYTYLERWTINVRHGDYATVSARCQQRRKVPPRPPIDTRSDCDADVTSDRAIFRFPSLPDSLWSVNVAVGPRGLPRPIGYSWTVVLKFPRDFSDSAALRRGQGFLLTAAIIPRVGAPDRELPLSRLLQQAQLNVETMWVRGRRQLDRKPEPGLHLDLVDGRVTLTLDSTSDLPQYFGRRPTEAGFIVYLTGASEMLCRATISYR